MKRIVTPAIGLWLLLSSNLYAQISFNSPNKLTDFGDIGGHFNFIPFYKADIDNDGFDDVVIRKSEQILWQKNLNGIELDDDQILYRHNTMISDITDFMDVNKDGLPDFFMTTDDSIFLMQNEGGKYVKASAKKKTGIINSILMNYDLDGDGDAELYSNFQNIIKVNRNWKTDLLDFREILSVDLVGNEYIFSFDVIRAGSQNILIVNTDKHFYVYLKIADVYQKVFGKEDDHQSIWDTGDINLDGYIDIVVGIQGEIFSLTYDETNQTFLEKDETASEQYKHFYAPVLIDIDNNNTLDLCYDNFNLFTYLANSGDGTFTNEKQLSDIKSAQGSHKNVKFDFNNDGKTDLLTGGFGIYKIFIIVDDSNVTTLEGWYTATFRDIKTGDLDGDGYLDIVGFNVNGSVEILYGDIDGKFEKRNSLTLPYGTENGYIGDLNNDNILDILCLSYLRNHYYESLVFYGSGNRSFSNAQRWKAISSISGILEFDYDQDGIEDLFQFDVNGSGIQKFVKGNLDYDEYYTSGNSHFDVSGSGIYQIDTIDINNDSYLDIITANNESGNISILINDASGSFVEQVLDIDGKPLSIASYDYNNDGWQDILTIIENPEYVYNLLVLINDKQNNFTYKTAYPLSKLYNPVHLDKIDLDNDGDKDIVAANYDYLSNYILEKPQHGDTLILQHINNIENSTQSSRTYGDLNNDGKIDIINGLFFTGIINVMVNNSVIDPDSPSLTILYDTVKHQSAVVKLNNVQSNGTFAVVKEGSELSFIPQDGMHYVKNSNFGVGENVEDKSFVVFIGSDTTFQISDLNSNTTYELNVFEYNSNLPDNTIINYGSEAVTSTFTTKKAIFSILDFPDTIKIEEDSILTIELSEYINDFGENEYQTFNENNEVSLALEGTKLTITPNQDYFGTDSISISASLPTELFKAGFYLEIISVNDPPMIAPVEEHMVVNTDMPGSDEAISVEFSDPDDADSNLRIEVSSSNQNVVANSNIQAEVKNGELIIKYNSSDYGISTITVIITDELGAEVRMLFDLEIAQITGLETSLLIKNLYPNPTTGIVYFKNPTGVNDIAVLYNLMGEIVMQNVDLNLGQVDLSHMSAGVYLLRSQNDTYRIIKE